MKEYRKLGDLVDLIDERNKDEKVKTLIGVSIDKCFIKSVANTIGTDLSKYQVIRKFDFACSLMQVSRDRKIPIACLKEYDEAIMSPAYYIFRIKNTEEILPDYMAMWFMRPEFDREASYIAVGGVRGSMPWEDFCDMKLPVPDIKEQQKIVDTYNAITNRIQIKQKINENLEKTAQAIFKELFDDNVDYYEYTLGSLVTRIDNRGKTPPNTPEKTPYPVIEIGSMKTKGRIISFENVDKYITKEFYETGFRAGNPKEKDILMSTVGSLADLKLFWGSKGSIAQNIIGFRCKNINLATYVYQYMIANKHELMAYEIGSVQASIKVTHVIDYKIKVPTDRKLIEKFDFQSSIITKKIYENICEIAEFEELRKTFVSQISKR